jgi:hypothetical protein
MPKVLDVDLLLRPYFQKNIRLFHSRIAKGESRSLAITPIHLKFSTQADYNMPLKQLPAEAIYPIADAPYIQFASRRSVVHSTGGMVASTQPLASEAGQRILKMGGNAAVSLQSANSMKATLRSTTGRCGGSRSVYKRFRMMN